MEIRNVPVSFFSKLLFDIGETEFHSLYTSNLTKYEKVSIFRVPVH
jgi:hypothetical protein